MVHLKFWGVNSVWTIPTLPVVTRTKLVRGYMVPHSVSKQRLVLFEDTFTIITGTYKEAYVVIVSLTFVQPEKVIHVGYNG